MTKSILRRDILKGVAASGLAGQTTFAQPIGGRAIYVSPAGDDSNPGTLQRPFATVTSARDAIRTERNRAPQQDFTVWIRGGTYYLRETVVFGLEDSAAQGHTIKCAAFGAEDPVFSSGVHFTDWKKVEDPPEALPPAAKGRVWLASVPAALGRFHSLFDSKGHLVCCQNPLGVLKSGTCWGGGTGYWQPRYGMLQQ